MRSSPRGGSQQSRGAAREPSSSRQANSPFTASQKDPLRPLPISPPVRRGPAPGGRGAWWCLRGFADPHVSRLPSERQEERSPVSRTPSLRRRLLPAFAGAALLLGAMGAAARGESYGELGHFGAAGTSQGFTKVVGAEHPCSASRVGALKPATANLSTRLYSWSMPLWSASSEEGAVGVIAVIASAAAVDVGMSARSLRLVASISRVRWLLSGACDG